MNFVDRAFEAQTVATSSCQRCGSPRERVHSKFCDDCRQLNRQEYEHRRYKARQPLSLSRNKWDEAAVIELRKLIAGGFSGSEISRLMNVTRCSVMGKASRLGLMVGGGVKGNKGGEPRKAANRARKSRGGTVRTPLRKPHPRPALPKCEAIPDEQIWQALPDANPVGLLELEPHQCRWPIGPDVMTYCGTQALEPLPYCGRHAAIAYRPSARV